MNTEEIITKIQTRFNDLDPSSHEPPEGKACIMELVAWANGEPWSDFPSCVPREIARLCQIIHDFADPSKYATIWTPERMRSILSAAGGRGAMLQRAYYAAEYARASAVRLLRARGHDTSAIDVCAPVTDEASAEALRDALRAAYAYAYAAADAADAADAAYAYAAYAYAAADAAYVAAYVAAYAAYAYAAAADADAYARQTARIEILDAWCAIGRTNGEAA